MFSDALSYFFLVWHSHPPSGLDIHQNYPLRRIAVVSSHEAGRGKLVASNLVAVGFAKLVHFKGGKNWSQKWWLTGPETWGHHVPIHHQGGVPCADCRGDGNEDRLPASTAGPWGQNWTLMTHDPYLKFIQIISEHYLKVIPFLQVTTATVEVEFFTAAGITSMCLHPSLRASLSWATCTDSATVTEQFHCCCSAWCIEISLKT